VAWLGYALFVRDRTAGGGTPRSLSAMAMAFSVVTPAARSSAIKGASLVALSARAWRTCTLDWMAAGVKRLGCFDMSFRLSGPARASLWLLPLCLRGALRMGISSGRRR
jgi:hypothetical protein